MTRPRKLRRPTLYRDAHGDFQFRDLDGETRTLSKDDPSIGQTLADAQADYEFRFRVHVLSDTWGRVRFGVGEDGDGLRRRSPRSRIIGVGPSETRGQARKRAARLRAAAIKGGSTGKPGWYIPLPGLRARICREIPGFRRLPAYRPREGRGKAAEAAADYVRRWKLAAGCIDCGYAAAAEALDFDHVRGVKRASVGVVAHTGDMAALVEEIRKCVVRCANCHRVVTRQRRPSKHHSHPKTPVGTGE